MNANRTKPTRIATGAADDCEMLYEYDLRNRLVKVTHEDETDVVTSEVEYVYDSHNRRIAKIVDEDADGVTDKHQRYVYDGDHIALAFEDVDADGDVEADELTQRLLYGSNIDELLAAEIVTSTALPGDVLWTLPDNLGTLRDIANYDDGSGNTTVVNHLKYDAFGNIASESATSGSASVTSGGFIFAYTAREYDAETGLFFYRARYYDAAVGRFIQEDPIGFGGEDANLFRYVGNEAPNAVDPSGHKKVYGTVFKDSDLLERIHAREKQEQIEIFNTLYRYNEYFGEDGHYLLLWAMSNGMTFRVGDHGVAADTQHGAKLNADTIVLPRYQKGTSVRRAHKLSPHDRAVRLHLYLTEALSKELHEQELEYERELLIGYYGTGTWGVTATAMAQAWRGFGVKSMEAAYQGSTITGRKLGAGERWWMGLTGSVELALTVIPPGKAVGTLASRGYGRILGANASKALITRVMTYDLLLGAGGKITTSLSTSRVGMAFLKTYKKVYDHKWNKALWGEKVPVASTVQALDDVAAVGNLAPKGELPILNPKFTPRPTTHGRVGEVLSGLTGKKTKISINGRNRFPDGLTGTTLTEVKNVANLSYTRQLRDFAVYARQNGLIYELYVRPTTKLSRPLLEAIENGDIILKTILGL